MNIHKLKTLHDYKAWIETCYYPEYVHVKFVTQLDDEPRTQFEMFLDKQELDQLITCLNKTQYYWHKDTTHR